eukprot:1438143-Amphidinium_carterae.1
MVCKAVRYCNKTTDADGLTTYATTNFLQEITHAPTLIRSTPTELVCNAAWLPVFIRQGVESSNLLMMTFTPHGNFGSDGTLDPATVGLPPRSCSRQAANPLSLNRIASAHHATRPSFMHSES